MGRAKGVAGAAMRRVARTPLTVPCYYLLEAWQTLRCATLGRPRVTEAQRLAVERDVTFLFKSFNRRRKALRLLRSIRSYYPGATVVVADDSERPLEAPDAEVVRLPFNSGLGRGLEAALGRVRTPYVMRLDDDLVLTPHTRVHDQLAFLEAHPEADLCAVQMCELPALAGPGRKAERYASVRVGGPRQLVPRGTAIGERVVVEKASNCFLARTGSVRRVGWDPNWNGYNRRDSLKRD